MGERTDRLVTEMQKWAKAQKLKNKELAEILGITPQGMTEIFKGRNQPTGEQALAMLELMKRSRR
jgi:predicted XRE-type DNA-binding protein